MYGRAQLCRMGGRDLMTGSIPLSSPFPPARLILSPCLDHKGLWDVGKKEISVSRGGFVLEMQYWLRLFFWFLYLVCVNVFGALRMLDECWAFAVDDGLVWTVLLWLHMFLLSWRSPRPRLTHGVGERSLSTPVHGLPLQEQRGWDLGPTWLTLQRHRPGSTHQTLAAISAVGALSL